MRLNKVITAHLLLLLANLIYGVNYTVSKIPMPEYIQAYGIVLLRCVAAVLFFWVLHYFIKSPTKKQKIDKKDWPRFILSGLFGVAINQLLFFKGLDLSQPISSSIIMTSTPIAVLIVAIFIANERLTWKKGLGLFLGLVGALALILSGEQRASSYAPNPTLGNILIFINALSYAVFLVISKKLVQKYDNMLFMKWVFTIGFFIVLPFGFSEVFEAHWAQMTTEVWLAIGFILIFVSCLTYYFTTVALNTLPSSTVGIYIYAQPVFAVLTAIILGADQLDIVKIVSALMIFVGVYLVSKNNKARAHRLK